MSSSGSESLRLSLAASPELAPPARRGGVRARLALGWEVVTGGLIELWAHKMRSILTLTLLMLGVFALVVMMSVLDGVKDKIATGFAGMSWDGTLLVAPQEPRTSEEQKRFAMSPGLRYEDLARLTVPNEKIIGFAPRATKRVTVRTTAGPERAFVTGVTADYAWLMNRPVALGRGLTEDDQKRRRTVAVVGATLASKLFGGADPVGRDLVVEGVPYRIVGVQAPGMLMSDETYMDANGLHVPLETYMDRLDATHALSHVAVKLRSARDFDEMSALVLARVRQAHHGVKDVRILDLDSEGAKAWNDFLQQMRGWAIVLYSLAFTVLLVGGVGVLSVMLISFSERRYEIGLRKSLGASDGQILGQFLLEALVLAALGAVAGTLGGAALCRALSDFFPYGLVVSRAGLVAAWGSALLLAAGFGLYPALRASKLSPMEAMR
jgi:putative ABC transport system permease protein